MLNKNNILPTGGKVILKHHSDLRSPYIAYNDNRVFGLDQNRDVVFDLLLPTHEINELHFASHQVLALHDASKDLVYFVDLIEGTLLNHSMQGDLQSTFLNITGDGTDEYLHHNGEGKIVAYPNL